MSPQKFVYYGDLMKISNISYLRYPLINAVKDALEGGEYVDQSEIPPIVSQTTSGVCYATGPWQGESDADAWCYLNCPAYCPQDSCACD